jgi:hypothetical protein
VFFTSSSLLPISQELNLYGPVPTGFFVAKVPDGLKTPPASTVPASALYFLRAVGLAIPKFGRPRAARNEDERRVRSRVTLEAPLVRHPL